MVANNVVDENQADKKPVYQQFDLFTDYDEQETKMEKQKEDEIIDKKIQKVMLDIKKKYGNLGGIINGSRKGWFYITG